MDAIASYYDSYDEEGRLFNSNAGKVEFLTTMRYVKKYLREGARVIEIGAGTGRYSRAIAEMGHKVQAVELLPRNIDIFKKALKSGQDINITQGNALDLPMFDEDSFDITLLLGPMYHLFTDNDKRLALSQAIRVTKPGGVIFAAYCISDGTLAGEGFQRKRLDISDYIGRGKINAETFDTVFKPSDIFELTRKEDIDRLMAGFGVQRLHYVATDMLTKLMRDSIDAMNDDEFDLYLRYHYAVCERSDMVGVTHHSLDIFRKASQNVGARPVLEGLNGHCRLPRGMLEK
ncbi:MAG: class I SAM-dependent methyltransferase [Treponema sp.]|nr:class I SAM-dependent methyltransferase [Treponema sp.]